MLLKNITIAQCIVFSPPLLSGGEDFLKTGIRGDAKKLFKMGREVIKRGHMGNVLRGKNFLVKKKLKILN